MTLLVLIGIIYPENEDTHPNFEILVEGNNYLNNLLHPFPYLYLLDTSYFTYNNYHGLRIVRKFWP